MSKISFDELKKEIGVTNVVSYPVSSANSVYFLMDGDEIVYVGVSDYFGVYARFKTHKLDKEFNRYTIIQTELDRHELETLEKGLISLLRPKYNSVHNRFKPEAQKYAIEYLSSKPQFLSHDFFVVTNVVERVVEKIVEVEKVVEIKSPELPPIIETVEKIIEVPTTRIIEVEVDKYERREDFHAVRYFIENHLCKIAPLHATIFFAVIVFVMAVISPNAIFVTLMVYALLPVPFILAMYPEFEKDIKRASIVYRAIILPFSIALLLELPLTILYQ